MRITALFMIIITIIGTLIMCSKGILSMENTYYSSNTFTNISAAFVTYLEFKHTSNETFPKPISEADLFTLLSLLLQDVPEDDKNFRLTKQNMYLDYLLGIVYKVSLHAPYKYKTLIQLLKKKSDIENDLMMNITNAIYVSNKIKLSSNFLSLFNNKIPISNINFQNNIHVAKTFNLWAQKATNNKILNIILPRDIEEDTTFVLVTGVYFNNRLLNVLEGNTEKRRFHVSQTESYYVPMIKFKKALYKCAYIQDWHTIFIEIPLDKNITMIIFLPTTKITLAGLEKRFDFLIFQNYRNKAKKNDKYTYIWQLYLPKFKFEITHSLHGIRKKTRNQIIEIAQSNVPLKVNEIIQKISIEFNEHSSITTVAEKKSEEMAFHRKDFIVDRSFMFVIEINGIVLYAGSMRKPDIFQERKRDEL